MTAQAQVCWLMTTETPALPASPLTEDSSAHDTVWPIPQRPWCCVCAPARPCAR